VKKKLLFEDATMYYNKWVSGLATREFNAQRLRFKDLYNKSGDTYQSPNDSKASNVIPYPLSNAVPILGDLVVNTTNAIRTFKTSLENPVVKDDKKATAEVQSIISHLELSLREIDNIFKEIQHRGSEEAKTTVR
jgi:hypothetical protein